MQSDTAFFCPDPRGFVRHWLVDDVTTSPYTGPAELDDHAKRDSIAALPVPPCPKRVRLGDRTPSGGVWQHDFQGENIFCEFSAFYRALETAEVWVATGLTVDRACAVTAELWASGCMTAWLNGERVAVHAVTGYMWPERREVGLSLKPGSNVFVAHIRVLGLRDTRMLAGLRFGTEAANRIRIMLPGADDAMPELVAADRWLRSVRAPGPTLGADAVPPCPVRVRIGKDKPMDWAEVEELVHDPGSMVALDAHAGGERLIRQLQMPGRPERSRVGPDPDAMRRALLHDVTRRSSRQGTMAMLARHALGDTPVTDAKGLEDALAPIDKRFDCADFGLAAILRLAALGAFTPEQTERAAASITGFRYWSDETGQDAMCFGSENHAALFHSSQMMAGQLFPDAKFSASGRRGHEQARIGAGRCRDWLDEVAGRGFREFLSSTYMPVTAAALLNIADFSEADDLRERAQHLLDRLFRGLARHSFDGVMAAPQGRVYRTVLAPETTGTQALLAYAAVGSGQVPEQMPILCMNAWLVFPLTSEYSPPADVLEVMQEPANLVYREGYAELAICKSAGFLLASVQLPASFEDDSGDGPDVPPQARHYLEPGVPGYQQHLWHATLAWDCHVFVNHPGESMDLGSARPGYWYGNGWLPTLRQEGSRLTVSYSIPEHHPISFTHAYWPRWAFDEQIESANWVAGQRGQGRVFLSCSEPLAPHDGVLTDAELRACGRNVTWYCACADLSEDRDLAAFAERIRHNSETCA